MEIVVRGLGDSVHGRNVVGMREMREGGWRERGREEGGRGRERGREGG